MSTPKEFYIDSFEKLCNVVNEENVIALAKDLQIWLVSYSAAIELYRATHPEETKGKQNYEIAEGSFTWVDDGRNDLLGYELKAKETGEIRHIDPNDPK